MSELLKGPVVEAVLGAHQLSGATRFSHRNGQSFVEYPRCGCGEQMHPRSHPRHVAEALAAVGLIGSEQ